jgi:hypothetical protein
MLVIMHHARTALDLLLGVYAAVRAPLEAQHWHNSVVDACLSVLLMRAYLGLQIALSQLQRAHSATSLLLLAPAYDY